MSSHEGIITRLVARVKALLPTDWMGRAGERFRETVADISQFADEHNVKPGELLGEGVELGRRKLQGLANHEFAQAVKNFAEAEKTKTDAELQRRSLETDVSRREAEANKAHAEARLAELNAVRAELELLERLQNIGVILRRDSNGQLTALPKANHLQLMEIVERRHPLPSRTLPPEIFERADGLYVIVDYQQSVIYPNDRVTIKREVAVRGDVRALIVEIFGTVHGNVEAGHVELRKDGKLFGDVRTGRIIIEDGAYFKGGIDILKRAD